MSKATTAAPAPSALSRWWQRWRFHLNALLILIPLGFMPKYFHDVALFRGDSGLGEREIGEVQVGPWSLRLAEFRNLPPQLEGPAGYMKAFNAALCQGCGEQVKATYLRIGKPRSLRAAGGCSSAAPIAWARAFPYRRAPSPTPSCGSPPKAGTARCTRHPFPWPRRRRRPSAWLKQQGGKP